jgi:hypothetical protein
MDLSFNKVTYDGELTDFSEDELRELVGEYEKAQDSNVAEFKQAAEATENIDESTIDEFEDARSSILDEITESENFDEVPLTEDQLEDCDFGELQDWQDFVLGGDGDEETEESGSGFDDFGTRSPTGGSDDESPDFVEEQLGDIQGLQL